MKYQSTRNRALTASPAAAVLRGIAPDGGLYMPEAIPVLNWQSLLEADTLTLSARILSALLPDGTPSELSVSPVLEARNQVAQPGQFEEIEEAITHEIEEGRAR